MKIMNRSAYLAASVGAVAMYALATLAADADVGVTVNGSAVDIAPAPIVQDGRVFVPLRGVFEQLGASVAYSNGTINATGSGRDIALQIGSTQATVNDRPQTIDVAPFIVGESTYVPLRFISEALGDSVSWDDADSIAAIDTGGGPADYYSPGTASYVDTAPPPIPSYDQPYVPYQNDIWQPGYWAWGSYGYYWVPGTWIQAPQTGYLWTPGYWQGSNAGFHWNPGYWARAVGFYGGVNYGSGYYGNGYDGGRWSNNVFRYNTYVTRVNVTNVRNVYVDRSVYVNNSTTRIGYNGGKFGLRTRPTTQQSSVSQQRHLGMTQVQQQHVRTAEMDRRLLASVNHNRPPVFAVARPLTQSNPPSGLVPVKAGDRVNPLANVAPVHVPARHAARPVAKPVAVRPAQAPAVHEATAAYHAPTVREVPATQPKVREAPAYHAPVVHAVAPAYRAPATHEAPAVHAPAVRETPAYRAPVVHEVAPAYRAPAVRAAAPVHVPAVYAAPAYHAPAFHPAPAQRAAPVQRVAPQQVAPPQRAAPAQRAAPPQRVAPPAAGNSQEHKPPM